MSEGCKPCSKAFSACMFNGLPPLPSACRSRLMVGLTVVVCMVIPLSSHRRAERARTDGAERTCTGDAPRRQDQHLVFRQGETGKEKEERLSASASGRAARRKQRPIAGCLRGQTERPETPSRS